MFKLLSTNFRGIRSKVESFANTLNEEAPHFIAGTESWLNPSVFNNEIFPNNYQVFPRIEQMDMEVRSLHASAIFAVLRLIYPHHVKQ